MSNLIYVVCLGAGFVNVVLGRLLIWSHGPPEGSVWFPDVEDHGHTVLKVVAYMAVDNPGAFVIHRNSEDHISFGWYLDGVLEDWVVELPRENAFF